MVLPKGINPVTTGSDEPAMENDHDEVLIGSPEDKTPIFNCTEEQVVRKNSCSSSLVDHTGIEPVFLA